MQALHLDQLYVRLERPIYNVVYRWVWNAPEAQDLVQEAFLRLWRMRDRVDPATVEPLLYRIALNLAASRVRSKKIWRWISLEAIRDAATAEPDPEDRLQRDASQRRVREAIETLPDDLRQVVLLCEFSELSYDEIAAVLRIPSGTVGSRRHRALQRLREALADEANERRPASRTS